MSSDVNSSFTLDFEATATPTIVVPCSTVVLKPVEVADAKFTTVSESNTLVMNTGGSGVDYHANAFVNSYTTLKSGATAWSFGASRDYIEIPDGVAVDDLSGLTFEALFFLKGAGGGGNGRLWAKRQNVDPQVLSDDTYFEIFIDDAAGCLVINRATIQGEIVEWRTAPSSILQNTWNFIQIPWESGWNAQGNVGPTVYLNNKELGVTQAKYGNAPWASDRGNPAFVGNQSLAGGYNINGDLALFRMYRTAQPQNVCTSNYLAEVWRTHDPATGAIVVPTDVTPLDTDPFLRIGKNLNGIDVSTDYSKLITVLRPRGAGSAPSELRLDSPEYWPAAQVLELANYGTTGVYLQLPSDMPHSSYAGFTGEGGPIPSNYHIGRGIATIFQKPQRSQYVDPYANYVVRYSGDAVAYVISLANYRYWSVALQLGRWHNYDAINHHYNSQPQFIVGLYTCGWDKQTGVIYPDKGPLIWSYGNLLDIPPVNSTSSGGNDLPMHWYEFKFQTVPFPPAHYSWVISQYPVTAGWDNRKPVTNNVPITINGQPGTQTTVTDYGAVYDFLYIGAAPSVAPADHSMLGYATWCENGMTPANWMGSGAPGGGIGWSRQMAIQINMVGADVTNKFRCAYAGRRGRYVWCHRGDYDPAQKYIMSYLHEANLIDFDAYEKYGEITGTWTDSSLTSQYALVQGGSQYLQSVSQPEVSLTVSAIDLYAIDPYINWADEITLGSTVTVVDDVIGFQQECIVSKITRKNLDDPHDIDIQLNNVKLNTAKLLSQIESRQRVQPKYQQGATVATPFTSAVTGDKSNPATASFAIRDITKLTHSVKMTIMPTELTQAYKLVVDGNSVTK
jgi:Protein of unknown function (DUF1142).